MKNVPEVKIGLVAVSRDCFPMELSKKRRAALAAECRVMKLPVIEIRTVVENEAHVLTALEELKSRGVNALCVFLGNFGPEGPSTLLAQRFDGPAMFCAAAEETQEDLYKGRGDAYCGMLNVSYNSNLRKLKAWIPEHPVGTAPECAAMISDFTAIARVRLGLKQLKIFAFGPRPQDFLACNAPIKPLYDLGVEVMENSELDLYDLFLSAKGDKAIPAVARDMARELGKGNTYPDLLQKLAQYEVALKKFMEKNLGASCYGIFANKCWPSFEKYFGFVPCYVNSRFASRGIPVSCEVDIYGALSEYMATCATQLTATLLDINNTVPDDMVKAAKGKLGKYTPRDLFMGFHCGNTAAACLCDATLKFQLIMNRLMEGGKTPDITRGTLEGTLKPGKVTLFRLQSTADACLRSYVAEGDVLDINPRSFGGIGIIAVPEMARFYRHVLIERNYPHHAALAFDHAGKTLFAVCKMLGVDEVMFNQPKGMIYRTENPYG